MRPAHGRKGANLTVTRQIAKRGMLAHVGGKDNRGGRDKPCHDSAVCIEIQSAGPRYEGQAMKYTFDLGIACFVLSLLATPTPAQDVPGIEICTRESRLDQRTSCLQSNVEFLQQVVTRNALDAQQKLAAANRDIAALKEQSAAATREVAALKDALAAMEAKIGELLKTAAQPTPDAKRQGK